ncbi:hypothetical protein GBAR_LOCUS24184, partial [Geodia barretti]
MSKEGESEVRRNEGREGEKKRGGRECAADLAGTVEV